MKKSENGLLTETFEIRGKMVSAGNDFRSG